MDLWDYTGKERVGLAHLLLCVQDQHFQHQDGMYKFSAAQRQQRSLGHWTLKSVVTIFFFFFSLAGLIFYIQATYEYANLDA